MNFFNKRNIAIKEINKCIDEKKETLDISDMNLIELPIELKEAIHLEILRCDSNLIKKIENIPPNLKSLSITNNCIKVVENLTNSLEMLDISGNIIEDLNILSDIHFLICNNNKICNIINIPNSLQILLCSNNELVDIDSINNKNIKTLNCSNNKIIKLNNLPKTIEILDCSNNPINEILNIPHTLNKLVCYNTVQLINIDPKVLLLQNLEGLNMWAKNNLRNLYANKIQRNAQIYLYKKKYKRRKLIKHINDVSTFPANMNVLALKVYYVNPYCNIASKGIK